MVLGARDMDDMLTGLIIGSMIGASVVALSYWIIDWAIGRKAIV